MAVLSISDNEPYSVKKPVIYEFDVSELTNLDDVKNNKTYSKGVIFYNKLYNSIWNYIFLNYKRKDNFIKVNFTKNDSYVYVTAAELLLYLMFWKLHVVYTNILKKEIEITPSDLYDLSRINKKNLTKILEKNMSLVLEDAQKRKNGVDELSYYVSKIIDDFMEVSNIYSNISCNTISLYDTIQLEKRSKEFKECLETQLSESKTNKELEEQLYLGSKKLMKCILEDNESSYVQYIKGDRMNVNQFTQMFYAVGPRADVDKTILPKIMKGNYLHGYSSPSDAYIDAITGRDSQILKYISVRESGYLSRKINIDNLNTRIDYDVKDCGTSHYITYEVKTENHLRSIDLKYMILPNGKLKLIHYESDKDLIGKTIKLRSHTCCALTGNRVCMTCFGYKSKRLKGTLIGGLPAVKFANPISQRLMQAKHFSTTNAVDIKSEYLDKYFNKENSKLYFKKEMIDKDVYIVIDREFVEEIAEGATSIDDESIDTFVPLESFSVRDKDNEYLIECEGLFLVLTDDVLEESKKFIMEYDSDVALIPVSKIDKEIPIFNMVIITEEVSRYLKKLKRLIDSSYTRVYKDNISQLIMDIGNLLLDMGIASTSIINIETLVYQLIRKPDREYERPDFSKNEEFTIIPLSTSIQKSNIYTAFAFEKYKKQLTDMDTFENVGSGIFDSLFKINRPDYLTPVSKKSITDVVGENN